jgi:hypothetical protein
MSSAVKNPFFFAAAFGNIRPVLWVYVRRALRDGCRQTFFPVPLHSIKSTIFTQVPFKT